MEDVSVFFQTRDMIDKVVLYDEFEMDALDVSQMVNTDQLEMIHLFLYVQDLRRQEFRGDSTLPVSELI